MTTSGTFLHGNYWYNQGNPPFGRQGTSHGCVGLRDVQGGQGDTPAKWFYDNPLIGDVVVVKNSRTTRSRRTTDSTAGTCPGASGSPEAPPDRPLSSVF